MMAILEAAKYLNSQEDGKYVKFFVDSQAALLALENRKVTSELVDRLIKELNKAASKRSITLCWTKAHVGTKGNERADELAKDGTNSKNLVNVRIPKAELREKINDVFYEEWGREFSEYKGARMGKFFYSGPDKTRAKYVCKLARMSLARFVRVISGHNSLFYFRSKVDKEISPRCRFCLEADETFEHLINECPRFITYRREYLKDELITNKVNWSVQKLLNFSYLPGINDALEGETNLRWYGDGGLSSDTDELEEAEGIG